MSAEGYSVSAGRKVFYTPSSLKWGSCKKPKGKSTESLLLVLKLRKAALTCIYITVFPNTNSMKLATVYCNDTS